MITVSTIREQMGSRILALRERVGLSQAEFARKTKQGRSTVHGWESGRSKPDDEGMLLVAQVLGTSISYLYGETDDPRPPARWHTGEAPSSAFEETLIEVADGLEQLKVRVEKVIRSYNPLPDMTEADAESVFAEDVNDAAHGQAKISSKAARTAK